MNEKFDAKAMAVEMVKTILSRSVIEQNEVFDIVRRMMADERSRLCSQLRADLEIAESSLKAVFISEIK